MRSVTSWIAGAVLGLLVSCAAGEGAVSPGCLPGPLPETPGAPPAALEVMNFGERIRLDLWRQPCADGSGSALLLRATPLTPAFLCSGDFTLLQGGLEHNAALRSAPGGPRVCADLAGATTLIVDAASESHVAFNPDDPFALVFAGWDGGPRKFRADLPAPGDVPVTITAAVLPTSRSVQVGQPITAFAALIASGSGAAAGCRIQPVTAVPAEFEFRLTDPATNAITSPANAAATVAAGAAQNFLLAFTPTAPFGPTTMQLQFDCDNTPPASVIPGVNTLLLSASADPVPDLVALAATASGDGIVTIPGPGATGAFAVSSVNVGAAGAVTVSADTGDAALPVSASVCRTDPATGQCVSAVGPAVRFDAGPGQTSTFSVFVRSDGPVPFDPAANRIFVRFSDDGDVVRGATSVAVRTP